MERDLDPGPAQAHLRGGVQGCGRERDPILGGPRDPDHDDVRRDVRAQGRPDVRRHALEAEVVEHDVQRHEVGQLLEVDDPQVRAGDVQHGHGEARALRPVRVHEGGHDDGQDRGHAQQRRHRHVQVRPRDPGSEEGVPEHEEDHVLSRVDEDDEGRVPDGDRQAEARRPEREDPRHLHAPGRVQGRVRPREVEGRDGVGPRRDRRDQGEVLAVHQAGVHQGPGQLHREAQEGVPDHVHDRGDRLRHADAEREVGRVLLLRLLVGEREEPDVRLLGQRVLPQELGARLVHVGDLLGHQVVEEHLEERVGEVRARHVHGHQHDPGHHLPGGPEPVVDPVPKEQSLRSPKAVRLQMCRAELQDHPQDLPHDVQAQDLLLGDGHRHGARPHGAVEPLHVVPRGRVLRLLLEEDPRDDRVERVPRVHHCRPGPEHELPGAGVHQHRDVAVRGCVSRHGPD